jgi:hypothetical protein
MSLINTPGIRDINLEASVALPAAGATATSPSIDLGTTTPGSAPRAFLGFYVPAATALANTKNLVFTVQDSADNSSFAALVGAPVITITGPASGGSPAYTQDPQAKLPRNTRRYLRFTVTADSASGNVTGVTARLSVLVG